MWDPLAPNPILQGDPEANRRFAAALAAPAKFIVAALQRASTSQKMLGRDVAYSLAQKAATPAEAVRTVLGPGMQGGPGGLDMVMAAPMIARALRAAPAADSTGIRAYHGSPHDFDRFDMSKIGTGEGAQAYGHGLYFAERQGVARAYRDALARKHNPDSLRNLRYRADGEVLPETQFRGDVLDDVIRDGWDATRAQYQRMISTLKNLPEPQKIDWGGNFGIRERLKQWQSKLDHLESVVPANKKITSEPLGRMYEVNIRAKPEEFLDWDKPLSGQAPHVRAALNDLRINSSNAKYGNNAIFTGEDIYHKIATRPDPTAALRDAGIPGIRYLDQGSRTTSGAQLQAIEKTPEGYKARLFVPNRGGAQFADPTNIHTWSPPFKTEAEAAKWAADKINQGTSNYVLFRDDIIDILRKYALLPAGVAGVGALGAVATPDQAQAAPVDAAAIARALREGK